MPTNPHHDKRAKIEMDMIMMEAEKLWPLLTEEEKVEKRKEFAQRAGKVLVRETQILREESDAVD